MIFVIKLIGEHDITGVVHGNRLSYLLSGTAVLPLMGSPKPISSESTRHLTFFLPSIGFQTNKFSPSKNTSLVIFFFRSSVNFIKVYLQ